MLDNIKSFLFDFLFIESLAFSIVYILYFFNFIGKNRTQPDCYFEIGKKFPAYQPINIDSTSINNISQRFNILILLGMLLNIC